MNTSISFHEIDSLKNALSRFPPTPQRFWQNVSLTEWNDWHWQLANRVETLEDLKKYIKLTPEEEDGVRRCLGSLRMAITPYYLSLIDLDDPHDPIRRQAIPTAAELHQADADLLIGPQGVS